MGAGGSTTDEVVVWAWDRQSEWSQAANELKSSLFSARRSSLLLTVCAAVLATAGVQVGAVWPVWGRVLAGLSAVAIGLIAFLQRAATRKNVEDWTRARAVSEALKAETFRCLAGASPYRADNPGDILKTNVDRILKEAADLGRVTVGVTPKQRTPPAVHDVDSYIVERIQPQITTYYQRQSAEMRRRGDQYRCAATTLAVVALLLSAAATFTGWQEFSAWAPVVTTLIAALAANGAVNRYDALALEYSGTAGELQRLLLDRPRASDSDRELAADRFIERAEQVFAAQNQTWMARSVAAVDQGASSTGGSPTAPPADS